MAVYDTEEERQSAAGIPEAAFCVGADEGIRMYTQGADGRVELRGQDERQVDLRSEHLGRDASGEGEAECIINA